MKPAALNRALLVIAFLGVFVAGVLSVSHVLNLTLPCGPDSGCDKVTRHPSGFIADIPVAYFGFFAYLGFAGFALIRSIKGFQATEKLTTMATALAGVGFLYSVILQYIAINEIREMCYWCLSSATLMALTFFGHLTLRNALVSDPEAKTRPDFALSVVSFVLALIGVGTYAISMQDKAAGSRTGLVATGVELLPEARNEYGDANAKFTIIEFADLQCPGCKIMSPKIKEIVAYNPGKVKLVFRHWPLRKHPYSLPAAIISEYAAEKGKFWPYLAAAMSIPGDVSSAQAFFDVAAALNLDTKDIKNRVGVETDPTFQRVYRDIQAADQLGLRATPSFILVLEGKPSEIVTGTKIFDTLKSAPYNLKLPPGVEDPPKQ